MPSLPTRHKIHKEQATVCTASIDVKILRLDKRQMTMSVFRQLDAESIFMSDGTLRGVPWGRVNYLWKGNREFTAFHVIYERNGYIFRSPVPDGNISNYALRYWIYDIDNLVNEFDKEMKYEVAISMLEDTLENLGEYVVHEGSVFDRYGEHKNTIDFDYKYSELLKSFVSECSGIKIDANTINFGYSSDTFERLIECIRGRLDKYRLEYSKDRYGGKIKLISSQISKMYKLDQIFIAT